MSAINDNASIESWKEVVSHFRSLCFFRLQGNLAASENVLRHVLPKKISEWSLKTKESAAEKKAQLEEMFRAEQRRVDDAFALHELSARQWREDLMPAIANQISQEIRRAICEQFAMQNPKKDFAAPKVESRSAPVSSQAESRIVFDDIPAIIDLLVAEERKQKANFAA